MMVTSIPRRLPTIVEKHSTIKMGVLDEHSTFSLFMNIVFMCKNDKDFVIQKLNLNVLNVRVAHPEFEFYINVFKDLDGCIFIEFQRRRGDSVQFYKCYAKFRDVLSSKKNPKKIQEKFKKVQNK
jgi:hypothetical protein